MREPGAENGARTNRADRLVPLDHAKTRMRCRQSSADLVRSAQCSPRQYKPLLASRPQTTGDSVSDRIAPTNVFPFVVWDKAK